MPQRTNAVSAVVLMGVISTQSFLVAPLPLVDPSRPRVADQHEICRDWVTQSNGPASIEAGLTIHNSPWAGGPAPIFSSSDSNDKCSQPACVAVARLPSFPDRECRKYTLGCRQRWPLR